MQMLEEMQRQGAPAVEQIDIALLEHEEIGAAKILDEIEQAAPLTW